MADIHPVFEGITGHRGVLAQLSTLVRRPSRPSTYLFVGPSGAGLVEVARRFLLGLAAGDAASAYLPRLAAGALPDVVTTELEGVQWRVEQAAEVLALAYRAPLELAGRGFVLDDAEAMPEIIADKLLKLLEEPPPRVAFVLVAADEGSLRETVISRCRVVRFMPLDADEVATALVARGVPAAEASELAAATAGNLDLALSLGAAAERRDEFLARWRSWLDLPERLAGTVADALRCADAVKGQIAETLALVEAERDDAWRDYLARSLPVNLAAAERRRAERAAVAERRRFELTTRRIMRRRETEIRALCLDALARRYRPGLAAGNRATAAAARALERIGWAREALGAAGRHELVFSALFLRLQTCAAALP